MFTREVLRNAHVATKVVARPRAKCRQHDFVPGSHDGPGRDGERLKWAGLYAHGRQRGYFILRTKVPGGYLTPEQPEVIGR
ncbi:MAG: hypothetical protein V5A62_13290 [Haloarculaceae archaeon]